MKKFTVHYDNELTTVEKLTINNSTVLMIESTDSQIEVSDEYHSMHDLYEHRMALTIALFNWWAESRRVTGKYFDISLLPDYVQTRFPGVMKSKLHHDGTMFEGGYFIVMAVTSVGQISYHYKLKYWDKFRIPEVERTPEWDGHSSLDALERLMEL